MRVVRNFYGAGAGPIALCIGNFDGVHLGHQAMLARMKAIARAQELSACVLTFEPHPREFFTPQEAPPRLTNLREKLESLADLGVDRTYVARFDDRLASIDADEFSNHLLRERLRVSHVLIGEDFRYGRGRVGDSTRLAAQGHALGFEVSVMDSVAIDGERVSSTAIRTALAVGDLDRARNFLGRPYGISGRIIDGQKLGRKLGFPTANIALRRLKSALSGIFAIELHGVSAYPLPGAASLGVRPTVQQGGIPLLEVHLLDFDADIRGMHVRVDFLKKLRDEAKYADLETLKRQIAQDVDDVRRYFASK